MLTVLTIDKYEDGTISALVASYGREYAISHHDGGTNIFRTNGSSYERLPAWKRKADIKAINEFVDWIR